MKNALLALILLIPLSTLSKDRPSVVRSWTLTKEQGEMLQRIAKIHNDFHVSEKARAFHELDAEMKLGSPRLMELMFECKDGFYFGEFVNYSVTLDPDLPVVNFAFDAGTTHRGHGTILVTRDEVIRTMIYCGTDGCVTEVSINGKVIHSRRSKE